MDNLNRHRVSSRARTLRPKVLGFLVLLAGMLCVTRSFVQAAPITLQFEATVGPPRQGADAPLPPSWNIPLQQGDTVSGTFTFEPFDAPPNTSKTTLVQPFDFSLHIKSRTLTTSQYSVEVFNNTTSDENPEPTDIINLESYSVAGEVVDTPANVLTGDPIEWAFIIALFGDSIVLDGADIPSNVLAWQQLVSDNTMLVSFKQPVTGWSYGFLATIGSFQQVPEPSASVPIAISIMFMLGSRHVFRRHRA